MGCAQMIFVFLRSLLRGQSELGAENLALRQQPAILEQRSKRSWLGQRDRMLFCFIVLNEAHVRRILASYFACYHESRAHLSLECNAPVPRRVEHPSEGKLIAILQVGGLHHRYRRAA